MGRWRVLMPTIRFARAHSEARLLPWRLSFARPHRAPVTGERESGKRVAGVDHATLSRRAPRPMCRPRSSGDAESAAIAAMTQRLGDSATSSLLGVL